MDVQRSFRLNYTGAGRFDRPGADGGIGRRAGFRIPWGDPSEFESRSAHGVTPTRDEHQMTDTGTKANAGAKADAKMTVTLERKAASQVALQVEATPAEVDAAIEASLPPARRRASVSPASAPARRRRPWSSAPSGWETVRHETVDHLVPDLYRRAVDEVGVEPIGDPDLDLGELERDKPLKFTATVTIKPEVDLRDYLSLRVPMETTEITEAERRRGDRRRPVAARRARGGRPCGAGRRRHQMHPGHAPRR